MDIDKHKLPMSSVRLEALGDGIFSIAMTILVIDVALPVIKENNWNNLQHAFRQSWHEFLCYAISYIVLGIMWFGHRMMYEYIGKTNRYFIFLGVLFYMVVCLVPFSTRFLAENIYRWIGIAVYGLNLSLCNLTLYAQWVYGKSRPTLLHREVPEEVRREARLLFLLSPVVYSIAVLISFFVPAISIAIFIATPVVYLLPSKLDKYLP